MLERLLRWLKIDPPLRLTDWASGACESGTYYYITKRDILVTLVPHVDSIGRVSYGFYAQRADGTCIGDRLAGRTPEAAMRFAESWLADYLLPPRA